MKPNRIIFAFSLAAMVFAISCSSDENDSSYAYCVHAEMQKCLLGPFKNCQSGGLLSNDCPYQGSSSSLSSSSILNNFTEEGSFTYEGQTYRTIKIGEQWWTIDNAYGSCPTGWHSPSNSELSTLQSNFGIASNYFPSDYVWRYASGVWMVNNGFIQTTSCGKDLSSPSCSGASLQSSACERTDPCYNNNSIRCVQGSVASSSSGGGSSSSSRNSSSSSLILSVCTDNSYETGSPFTYEGLSYKTVKIGCQTWMAENLNYNVSGSTCVLCGTYGRRYNWATAMSLPSSCNSTSCASQINTKHKGICPSGWHIPSFAEWEELADFAGGGIYAGKKLKSVIGWNELEGESGNGTDDYGFTALPGGYGSYTAEGHNGHWWAANEYSGSFGDTHAYCIGLYYSDDSIHEDCNVKNVTFSVRCIMD
jgi:uncharacterized protein (TIGR02145 family)